MCWCTLKLYNLILCVMLNSFYMTWLGLPLNYHLMSLVRTIPPPNRELTRLIYGTVEQHESYLQMCDATNHHVIPNWKFQSHRSFQNFLSFQDWCKCKLIPALKFSADFQQNPILQKLPGCEAATAGKGNHNMLIINFLLCSDFPLASK